MGTAVAERPAETAEKKKPSTRKRSSNGGASAQAPMTMDGVPETPAPAPAPKRTSVLRVASRTLKDALDAVNRLTAGHTTLPILRNVLVQPGENELVLRATDLELGVEVRRPLTCTPGDALSLPGRTLAEIVGTLNAADVKLTLDPDTDQVLIESGNSEYRLHGLPAEDFPALPVIEGGAIFRVAVKDLEPALKQVAPCASDDDTRPILTGILLRVQQERLSLVATDAHRLAVTSLRVAGAAECEAIVPARSLAELLRLLDIADTLTVVVHENQVEFRGHDFRLQTRRIEGQFPKYERVIPSSSTRTWLLERAPLAAALRRLKIVARDAAAKDRVQCVAEEGTLTLSAQGDRGYANEQLDAELPTEHFAAAFNVNYLIEALAACGTERVRLDFTEPLSPAVMRPVDGTDFLEVIMPMQVQ